MRAPKYAGDTMSRGKQCDIHKISEQKTAWIKLYDKLLEVMHGKNSTTTFPCPLCLIEQLSEVNNEVGAKCKNILDAYNQLGNAIEDFENVLDKPVSARPSKDFGATKNPIQALEIMDDKIDDEAEENDEGEEDLPF